MDKRNGALLVGAALLLLLLQRKVAQPGTSTPLVGKPPITFPPVVPIGGGQVQQPEQRSGLGELIRRGIDLVTRTRGEKNNNPGNIRATDIDWIGEVPGKDPDFETFSTPEYGIRAVGKLLTNYYERYNLRTVREIISRYAPPGENNTERYIAFVAQHLGVAADSPLNFASKLPKLVEAILVMEGNPHSMATIQRSLALTA